MPRADRQNTVLVIDDDAATCAALDRAMRAEGYRVITCGSGAEAIRVLGTEEIHVVITDMVMDGLGGLAVLEKGRQINPDLPVIVCTGYGSIQSAVDVMRSGATDYLTKPIDLDALTLSVERALRASALTAENRSLRQQLTAQHDYRGVLGRSPRMLAVFEQIETVAPTDVTVLLRGESGTGKEVVARAIHEASPRAGRPLVTLNCAAVSENLVESDLFGHERGAFTGAVKTKRGKLELANGGTLFLDEIGELPHAAQSRLLRFLQERTFERVGGTTVLGSDVRIVAATHRDLEGMIREGAFREDLFYRLTVLTLRLPALRDRVEDIDLLAQHFLLTLAAHHKRSAPVLHRAAKHALLSYRWPGNVRELKNTCERLVVTHPGALVSVDQLPETIVSEGSDSDGETMLDGCHSLAQIEREAVFKTLARTLGDKVQAAAILGIGLKTLYRRLAEYGEADDA